ncbi:MAG: hypothetical protein U9P88_01485 [Patescibacteria group bacterium]|nr:hypothetical protein [Patescibacteria group bacterium]
MKKYQQLRIKYPEFIYKKYSYKISGKNLEILFDFDIVPKCKNNSVISFQPKISIENIDISRIKKIRKSSLNNLIFNIGLVELLGYWKIMCSPKIIINAGFLDKKQILWWKDLIIKGMGQYFYTNQIDSREEDFITIIINKNSKEKELNKKIRNIELKNRYLVPMGGGRDSIVTLEKLKKENNEINCFLVNPTEIAKKVTKAGNIKNPIIVKREIDPLMFELNKKGYLNGHTPFTALLSFLSVLCAVLFNYKNIAFSNEKSAEQGNLEYLGTMINHQYSKTFEFEKKFRNYCHTYLIKNINYFSYIRLYTEIEISEIFVEYDKYFSIFSSCNYGSSKGKRWCESCPKCLFVYATLYPFLNKMEIKKIFGKDFFEKKELLETMNELIGNSGHKPFECVGTKEETQKIFLLCLNKAKKTKIPFLLTKINL